MPSIPSQALYCWLVPPLLKAFRRPIQENECPQLCPSFASAPIFTSKARDWRLHYKQSGTLRPLWKVLLFDLSPGAFILGCTLMLVTGLVTTVGRPLSLRFVVSQIRRDDLSLLEMLGLVCFLGGVVLAEGLLTVWGKMLLCDHLSVRAFAFVSCTLVDKSASGPVPGDQNPSNLLGNDLVRILENVKFSTLLPSAITGILGGSVMLLIIIGPSSIVGLAFSFIIMASNVRMAKITKQAEQDNLSASDARMRLLKQTMDMIRGVKYFAWEARCLEQITVARTDECQKIRRFRAFQMLAINVGRMSPVLSCLITFTIYAVVLKQPMRAEDIFAALIIFQSMRVSLISIPANLTQLANVALSLKRVEAFIKCPDYKPRSLLPSDSPKLVELSFLECIPGQSLVEEAGESRDERQFVLKGVELSVAKGALVAVIGPVGSGKSTLINAMLGAMPLHGGVGTRTCRKVSLVPQKPVTLNATVLENVTMGLPYNDRLWASVVEDAQLHRDLELLPDGRDTLIGENGTTLSGGQQMRVSIARALYSEPDLLLLDDPLAALDHVVGSAVLNAVRSYAKTSLKSQQRAVVMVLNQVHLLGSFDQAVCLDAGTVQAKGSPAEVAAILGLDFTASNNGVVDDCADAKEKEDESDGSDLPKKDEVATLSTTGAAESGSKTATATAQKAEVRSQGNVSSSVYGKFLKAMGPGLTFFSVLSLILAYLAMVFADRWLSLWVTESENDDGPLYPVVYASATLFHAIAMNVASLLFAEAGMRASKTLHFDCLIRVLKAPMAWFEDTPSGRTISRFSSDLSMVDLQLTLQLDNLLQMGLACLSMLFMVVLIAPPVAAAVAVGSVFYYFQAILVDRMNREVKRMRDTAMSPVQTNLSETQGCAVLLQADAREGRLRTYFLERHFKYADAWNRHNFTSSSLMNCGQLITYFMSFGFCLATSATVLSDDSIGPELSSLAFAYCFMAPYFLGIVAMLVIMTNHSFTSLERLLSLQSPEHVPVEAWPTEPVFLDSKSEAISWPSAGNIVFESVQLRYRPGLPLAVCGVSFEVQGGERLGVLGRTGSGKSSLLVLLFRLVEPAAGRILVDGVDICSIGLHKLRSSLGMIPQTPVLLAGTVRQNLDPFNDLPGGDAALVDALRRAELGNLSLDTEVGSGGSRMSAGECQLLSFARCLLHDTRIVVLDEPTASVDLDTDAKLQALVRNAFVGRTLLCIAHRLQTIIDFDRLLVMNAGRVAGLGTPRDLLADASSALSQIVDGGGGSLRIELEKMLQPPVSDVKTVCI